VRPLLLFGEQGREGRERGWEMAPGRLFGLGWTRKMANPLWRGLAFPGRPALAEREGGGIRGSGPKESERQTKRGSRGGGGGGVDDGDYCLLRLSVRGRTSLLHSSSAREADAQEASDIAMRPAGKYPPSLSPWEREALSWRGLVYLL
jgi:hypothetical protein